MSLRKESIAILKQAVNDKTLGCYKGATQCLYYDKTTDSCCAVGVLVPKKQLMKNVTDLGNVTNFKDKNIGSGVSRQLKDQKTYRGLTKAELRELQRLHDNIVTSVNKNHKIERFEDYVNSLK